jgi:hypothetical protein
MPCNQDFRRAGAATGRARRGSQRQIQTQVNFRRKDFSERVLSVLSPSAPAQATLRWVSPLDEERFSEYRDAEFLEKLDLGNASAELLKRFWPSRGPCWDALAVVEGMNPHGVVLVEAKSHVSEMDSACKAGSDSRKTIEASLVETAHSLQVKVNPSWTEKYYQVANRYAHLYFLRQRARVPAWLVNVYFINDQSMDGRGVRRSVSGGDWREAVKRVKEQMGVGTVAPYVADLFVEAVRS